MQSCAFKGFASLSSRSARNSRRGCFPASPAGDVRKVCYFISYIYIYIYICVYIYIYMCTCVCIFGESYTCLEKYVHQWVGSNDQHPEGIEIATSNNAKQYVVLCHSEMP